MVKKEEIKFISLKEILKIIPASRATILRWEESGKFPKKIKLGESKVAWIESEVKKWMNGVIDDSKN